MRRLGLYSTCLAALTGLGGNVRCLCSGGVFPRRLAIEILRHALLNHMPLDTKPAWKRRVEHANMFLQQKRVIYKAYSYT